MPPKARPGQPSTSSRPPSAPRIGTPDVVTSTPAAASKDYSASIARAVGVPAISTDLPMARAIWADASKGIDTSGMDAETKKEAVLAEIRNRGPQYWAPWMINFQKSRPQSAAPAAAAPAKPAAPAADPLDAPVEGDDVPSAPPPGKPAARGRAPANQAPSEQSKAMRAWLIRYGEMPQGEVDAMSDSEVAVAKAKMQKARSGRPAPAADKPAAQAGKRSRGRPRASGAKPTQGESGVRRPAQTGSVVETEGEGVVNTVGDTPAGGANDLENLSVDQLEEMLSKARYRQATAGGPINVGAYSPAAGPLPGDQVSAAGVGVGADEIVVNRAGASQTTRPGEAPQPTQRAEPEPQPAPAKRPMFWNPFGTHTVEDGGQQVVKPNRLRKVAGDVVHYAPGAAAIGVGTVGSLYGLGRAVGLFGGGGSGITPQERQAIEDRAIEARRFRHGLFGTYDAPTTPMPDMQAPPENNIRAFQRGVR